MMSRKRIGIRCAGVLLLILPALLMKAQADHESDQLHTDLTKKMDLKTQGWSRGGFLNIGVNEGLLENWAAGGERMSFAANGLFNGFISRQKGSSAFDNTLDMHYGLSYAASTSFVPRKLDDRIDFSSRYGLQPKKWTAQAKGWKKNLYFMGLFRFQTQLSKGYDYSKTGWKDNPISQFLSPAYMTFALGMEWRNDDKFSLFVSPVAAKETFVSAHYTQNGTAFGVLQGKTSKAELGAYLTAKFKVPIDSIIHYQSRLDLYSNYLAKDKKMEAGYIRHDSPKNIDILWDNFFSLKINKYIGAGLGFTLIYDNDQPGQKTRNNNTEYGPLGWWQLKQILNVGFSYKFK